MSNKKSKWSDSEISPPINLDQKSSPLKKYVGEHIEEGSARKKKKTIANKDIRKERFGYNEYIERASILDQVYSESQISQSPFKGIFRLVLIIQFVYVMNNTLLRVMQEGKLMSHSQMIELIEQFKYGVAFWIFAHFFSYIPFLFHKLIIMGLNMYVIQWIEFIAEQFLFFYVPYLIYNSTSLWISSRMFMHFQMIIHYFKMNSYFKMNRDYREAYLKELKEKATFTSTYPKNVNLKDFSLYLLHPTFTYQDHYPLTNKRSLKTIFWRFFLVLLGITVMYITYEGTLVPLIDLFKDGISAHEIFSSWYTPVISIYFYGFFTVFDFVPNFYAEVSGFADRQFYQDFWNATHFDEFARKWNRLVHEFLHRHFYLEYLKRYKFTVFQASTITFVFSVLFHEVFLTVFFKRVSFYLSSLQINQIMFMFMLAKFKGTLLGNIIYWFGQFFGITSVAFNYIQDYANFTYQPGGHQLDY